jgi:hypothetical protein
MTLSQGDIGLLETDVAQRLLRSKELARVAYVARDGTPRVFPMLFHWNGSALVLCTFGGAKIKAMRVRPRVSVCIDASTTPPAVLLLRGEAQVERHEGVVPEYRLAHERYSGVEQAAATIAEIDHPGLLMYRITLTPAWVGVLDFQLRFPGGTNQDEFDRRGQA